MQIALLATDSWMLVSAMLVYIYLGVNSHIGYYTSGANSLIVCFTPGGTLSTEQNSAGVGSNLWCVPVVLGSQDFRVPSGKFQLERPVKSEF